MEGGRFILIAANNLAPCTPIENTEVLYEAGKIYGVYLWRILFFQVAALGRRTND